MTRFFKGYDPAARCYDQTRVPGIQSLPLLIDWFRTEDCSDWIAISRMVARRVSSDADPGLIMSGLIEPRSVCWGKYGYTCGSRLKVDGLFLLEDRDATHACGFDGLEDVSHMLTR